MPALATLAAEPTHIAGLPLNERGIDALGLPSAARRDRRQPAHERRHAERLRKRALSAHMAWNMAHGRSGARSAPEMVRGCDQ